MADTEEKKKKPGCLMGCLIAFGILIAICFVLGIVAAIAVPGFMKYIQESKAVEAKTNLKALADGVISYHDANEHFLEMPDGARLGPVVDSSTIGRKNAPNTSDFEVSPWKDFHFMIFTPYYYSYFYSTKTTPSGTVVQITASASLEEECDSVFYMIIDEKGASDVLTGDASLCNPLGIVNVK
ncbi:MAG: hypothetical protein IJM59_13580 [Proteobacteria bacterium]|nr:hypothetical protein [Pseudomonadota bacterium]